MTLGKGRYYNGKCWFFRSTTIVGNTKKFRQAQSLAIWVASNLSSPCAYIPIHNLIIPYTRTTEVRSLEPVWSCFSLSGLVQRHRSTIPQWRFWKGGLWRTSICKLIIKREFAIFWKWKQLSFFVIQISKRHGFDLPMWSLESQAEVEVQGSLQGSNFERDWRKTPLQ